MTVANQVPAQMTPFDAALGLLRARRFSIFCVASLLSNPGTWGQQVAEYRRSASLSDAYVVMKSI
jgi:hypothetical protein